MLHSVLRWICYHCSWVGNFPATTCPVCGNPVTKADI
jgi:rubrerythrin